MSLQTQKQEGITPAAQQVEVVITLLESEQAITHQLQGDRQTDTHTHMHTHTHTHTLPATVVRETTLSQDHQYNNSVMIPTGQPILQEHTNSLDTH